MGATNVVATLVTFQTNGSGLYKIPQQFAGGKLQAQVSYIVGDLDSGSTIKIARVPPGAMLQYFDIAYAALGNAVTGQIGDSDNDRYVVAGGITSMAAAGTQHVLPRAGDYTITAAGVYTPGTVGVGYITTAWTDIILTTGGADFDTEHRIDFTTVYALVA